MAGAEVAAPGGGGRELATRVVVGAGLAAAALACVFASYSSFVLLVTFVSVLAWREMFRLGSYGRPYLWVGYLAICGWVASAAVDGEFAPVVLALMLMMAVVCLPIRRSRALSAMVYVGIASVALVGLGGPAGSLRWIVWIFAIVWSADIAAYAVGRAVGGPKLWPSVSPNKTWAGFAGACAAACGAAVLVGPYVHVAPLRAAVAGLLLGALAQGGDLFESALKRRAGVKNSGNLLPGHGGVLDRIDSLIPVAPAVAGAVALGWL